MAIVVFFLPLTLNPTETEGEECSLPLERSGTWHDSQNYLLWLLLRDAQSRAHMASKWMARQEGTRKMGTKQEREMDGENAAIQHQIELLRGELKRKQKELDELLMRSETLHPSAHGALQAQLEEEIEQLQVELNSLTVVAR